MGKRILFQEHVSHQVALRRSATEHQKMNSRFLQIAFLVLGTLVGNARCQTLPLMQGDTLSGKPIVLPDAAHGKIALLAMGFSKKGGDKSSERGEALQAGL